MARDEQNGISEWKCIPEWNFSVSARTPERNIYVELNGPYAWASVPFFITACFLK